MSLFTLAVSRLALLRPASKMGMSSWGTKVQALVPLLNKVSRSLLATPALAVSVMRGKNAARAAPMLAFSASRFCSAWRTSGRRTSSSDGTPAGRSLKKPCSASPKPAGRSAGKGWPTSSTKALSSVARWRVCWASDTLAASSRLCAVLRSSLEAASLSYFSCIRRRLSCRVLSVSRVTRSSSSSAKSVR